MPVISCFFRGWLSALSHPSLIFVKWMLNIVFAWALTAPFLEILRQDLDHSAMGPALFEQLDSIYLMEILAKYPQQIGAAFSVWLPAVIMLGLLNMYLNGGILDVLQRSRRPGWGGFLNACGAHFLSMIAVLVFTIILGVLTVGLPLFLCELLAKSMTWNPRLAFWTYVVCAVLIILLPGSWVVRIYHIARVQVCLTPNGDGPVVRKSIAKTIRLFASSIGFTSNRHFSTFFLWLLFLISHLAIFPLTFWLQRLTVTGGQWGFLQEWGIAQVSILLRITAGIAVLGGFLAFFRESAAGITKQEPNVPAKHPEDADETAGAGLNPFKPATPNEPEQSLFADQSEEGKPRGERDESDQGGS